MNDQPPMRFAMRRYLEDQITLELEDLDYKTTVGIVEMVWGTVPERMVFGGVMDEEWKLHIGGPHWLVVKRIS